MSRAEWRELLAAAEKMVFAIDEAEPMIRVNLHPEYAALDVAVATIRAHQTHPMLLSRKRQRLIRTRLGLPPWPR